MDYKYLLKEVKEKGVVDIIARRLHELNFMHVMNQLKKFPLTPYVFEAGSQIDLMYEYLHRKWKRSYIQNSKNIKFYRFTSKTNADTIYEAGFYQIGPCGAKFWITHKRTISDTENKVLIKTVSRDCDITTETINF